MPETVTAAADPPPAVAAAAADAFEPLEARDRIAVARALRSTLRSSLWLTACSTRRVSGERAAAKESSGDSKETGLQGEQPTQRLYQLPLQSQQTTSGGAWTHMHVVQLNHMMEANGSKQW